MNKKNTIALSMAAYLLLSQNIYAKEDFKLQNITVTAQKVKENIQEVPISMSLFDEFKVEDNNIRTLSDVADYVPNFQKFSTGGMGMYTPSIRGLSTDPHTLSSTVGTYVDGVPYIGSMGNNVILDDIERIEVLRGPQGTLYGKNAYGGVINVITKKPNNKTRGKIKVELGEDNKKEYSYNISGPVIKDKLYIGLSAKHYEKDGFIKNTTLNTTNDDRKDDNAKLYLRYTPTDNLEFSLISNYLKKDDDGGTVTAITNPKPRETYSDIKGYTKSKSLSHALKIKYDMEDKILSSTTTYKKYNDKRRTKIPFSPKMALNVINDSKYTNYSQEFKLSGEKNNIKYLTGIYLDKDRKSPDTIKNTRQGKNKKLIQIV